MKKIALLLVILLSIISYSQNNPQWIIYDTSNSNVPSNTVHIVVDQLNRKWISFYEAGIIKIDSTAWTLYNTSNSNIPTNSFSTINIDNEFNFGAGWEIS